jgi:hypothetical protein
VSAYSGPTIILVWLRLRKLNANTMHKATAPTKTAVIPYIFIATYPLRSSGSHGLPGSSNRCGT